MVDHGDGERASRRGTSSQRRRFAVGVAAWIAVLAAATWLSVAAHEAGPLGPDEAIADAIQSLPGWVEPLAEVVRAITTTQVVLVAGAIAAIGLWFAGWRAEAVALVAMLVVLPFAQAGLKDLVDRPRPDPALVDRRTGFRSESFPAGHVMSGTVLYGFLAWLGWKHRANTWATLAAGVLAGLLLANLAANVYMGVHWPTDVLGGVLWALVLLIPAVMVLGSDLLPGRRGRLATQRPAGIIRGLDDGGGS